MKHDRNLSLRAKVETTDEGWIVFPLSSEEPYQRGDGIEVLVHEPGAVDLSWLASGNAPLLDNHNRWDGLGAQIGLVRDAWLEGRRLYVAVEFRSDDKSQAVAKDVMAGLVRNVSVGYEVLEYTEKHGPAEEYRVTKWRPIEASFVPLPADQTVGVGRSATETTEVSMTKPNPIPGLDTQTDEQRAEAMTSAINEINALAAEHNCGDLARAFIQGAMTRGETPSLPLFRGVVAAQLPEGKPLVNTDIGLTDTEQRSFSIVRLAAVMDQPDNARLREAARFELEAVAAAGAARSGDMALPTDLMRSWGDFQINGDHYRMATVDQLNRAAMSASGNPNVMTTAHMADRFIENLRETAVLGRLGVTMLPGMSSDFEIPGGDTNISAAWLASEDANVAESTASFRKVEFAIHDLGVYTDLTRRALQQVTIGLEAYVRRQIVEAMALKASYTGLYGAGTSGVPTGLVNTSGIGSVTFAAAVPTRNELIDMNAEIAATNQTTEPTYTMNTTMRADLQKMKIDAGSGRFLMNGNMLDTGAVASISNQIVSGDIIGGVWSDMVWALFGGLELARSTEAKFLSGGIRLRAIQSMDFGVTRVGSFVLGNDG